MKALVTGGAGFIGSHLVDRLIKEGFEVVVVDNLYTGKKENINPNAIFYNCDITTIRELEKIFEKEKPDYVFHLAAQSYVSVSVKKPFFDANVNIIGGINLLECCRKYGIKKIIYSNSGGASYGNPNFLPISEGHAINPVSHYGISKHTLEHYIFLYKTLYDLNFTSLRYANIYGPRQDPFGEGGVVAIFAKKMLGDERPIIFGDGSQIRDYTYVDDVVEANIIAITQGDNEAFNIGTGVATSTQEIFNLIKNILGFASEPLYTPERAGDAKACTLDSKKMQNLGWKPKYSLKEGLEKTMDYFKKSFNSILLKENNQNLDKLELGCGKKPTAGYLHQDITSFEEVNLDFSCNPWEIDLDGEKITEVLALGVMEHLRFEDFIKTVKQMYSLLKKGGVFLFDVPDMKIWSEYLFNLTHNMAEKNPFPKEHVWATTYGWQRWPGDEHKSGWTREELIGLLKQIGFTNIEEGPEVFLSKGIERNRFHKPQDAHLYIRATK